MSEKIPVNHTFPLPLVSPDYHDWQLFKISENKPEFLKEVMDMTRAKMEQKYPMESQLYDALANVLYQERIRLTQKAWKADKPEEKDFWKGVKKRLVKLQSEAEHNDKPHKNNPLLNEILELYAWEIVGNFKPKTYRFATNVIPYLFSRLVNAAPGNRARKGKKSNKITVYDKFHFTGPIDHIRKLANKGTVVVVPTHFSNLDSLVIGWSLQSIGLPPFIYGAGLNLFGIGIFAYYMSRLGAYKVDRRKKNVVYLESLKNYSTVALRKGVHSLFFPGGTRSRSGMIEKRLKLGLLGTALEAQRLNIRNAKDGQFDKIFVVPAVLNYHSVLEAPALINQFLKSEGKSRFLVENDEYSNSYKMAKFIFRFLFRGSDITTSFAPPMDVFGNPVDEQGNSIGSNGEILNVEDYFYSNGNITNDRQRDAQYAKMLGERIVERFHQYNTVLTSHLLAFTAFQIIKKRYPGLDVFALLRLPLEDTYIDYDHFAAVVDRLKYVLKEKAERNEVQLAVEFYGRTDELIQHGFSNLGIYHAKTSLYYKKKKEQVRTEDMKLLYFYHNRLMGYKLEDYV